MTMTAAEMVMAGMVTAAATEAMAMEVPVVGPRAEPSISVIEPGVTGLLAPLDDVGAFAQVIERLLGDGALRQTMGAAGRQRAERLFSEERVFQIMEQHYGELAR